MAQHICRCQLGWPGAQGHAGTEQQVPGWWWDVQGAWGASAPSPCGIPAFPLGQGSRAASVCPGLSGPSLSLRILNKFLDAYQEDVLPWHECVEPCLSSLSAHSSDREVRMSRDSRQAGAALLAVPCVGQAWCW